MRSSATLIHCLLGLLMTIGCEKDDENPLTNRPTDLCCFGEDGHSRSRAGGACPAGATTIACSMTVCCDAPGRVAILEAGACGASDGVPAAEAVCANVDAALDDDAGVDLDMGVEACQPCTPDTVSFEGDVAQASFVSDADGCAVVGGYDDRQIIVLDYFEDSYVGSVSDAYQVVSIDPGMATPMEGFTALEGLTPGVQTSITVEATADGHQKTLKFMIEASDPPRIVDAAMSF